MTARFVHQPLRDILAYIEDALSTQDTVRLEVPDPDRSHGAYPGESVGPDALAPRHRPLRVWTDLADRLCLRLHTPRILDDGFIRLQLSRLDASARLIPKAGSAVGKYAPGSGFQRASKLEEPDFMLDLRDAVERCDLGESPRVLALGVNTADELIAVASWCPGATFVGIDHDDAALDVARTRFGPPHTFLCADLNDLPPMEPFDLVLCIDTLQSPGVDDRAVLRHVVQRLLTPRGGIIIGVPNCRHVDGELLHGARMVNFRQPELSLLLKGVAFYKKYLQQHHRRVFVTGKHELLITGAPIGKD
ncbi:MAG: class I SAM-dependent methyltransferase [Myxococcota bacterium]